MRREYAVECVVHDFIAWKNRCIYDDYVCLINRAREKRGYKIFIELTEDFLLAGLDTSAD